MGAVLAGVSAALGLGAPAPAAAQAAVPVVSQAVVQSVPGREGRILHDALVRLGRNPRDLQALLDAGSAAFDIGDYEAAIGFFRRAEQVAPGNGRAKAGTASALVRNGDPFLAIPLYQEAERTAPLEPPQLLDRGLAHDLVGDNASAQKFYRQALARGYDAEATRRLALSLAIGGDKRGSEAVLTPLLEQQDGAAWRMRVFTLAIVGQTEEAVQVANRVLPPDLAASIAPYLRYMPRLTPAQQAAAANFGNFPRASEIGQDDPRVALYAPPRRPALASADAALVPRGEPLGRRGRNRDRQKQETSGRDSGRAMPGSPVALAQAAAAPRVAPPEPQPGRVVSATPPVTTAPPAAAAPRPATVAVAPASRPLTPPVVASQPAPQPVLMPPIRVAAATPAPQPRAVQGPELGAAAVPARVQPAPSVPAAAPAAAAPAAAAPVPAAPAPAPPSPPQPRRSLADAFSDLSRPAVDTSPAAGAVDIRRLRPLRVPDPAAKPPPPSHPSRIWVQVATGRDKGALGFDWRRMTREDADVFRSRRPFVSAWGQTNRLLTGPFPSEAQATQFIAQLRKAGLGGAFVWTSPAGQVVDELVAR